MNVLLASAKPDSIPDLDSMTKAQLLAYAAEQGISGVNSTMLKADILSAVKEAVNKNA